MNRANHRNQDDHAYESAANDWSVPADKQQDSVRSQIDNYRNRLHDLIRRGRELRDVLASDCSDASVAAPARFWQQDCGMTVNELSGGSKAHWLARSFSEAFLVRGSPGIAVEAVSPVEIADRLLGVLERALASLSQTDSALIASSQPPAPHRFDFVHNVELRPMLEQAYADGRHALKQGDYELALLSYCGVLEAIVTDALEHKGIGGLTTAHGASGKIADWSFDTRLSVAEQAGLIRGECARLPDVARRYRDAPDGASSSKPIVSERDARLTGQVLHVVMRDLNPGR